MTLTDVLEAVRTGEISQIELVNRTGLSASAVSQICSSIIKSPRHDNAILLISALEDYRKEQKTAARGQS